MADVVWDLRARSDLMAILDFISDRNPTAALRLLREIDGKLAGLAQNPKMGPVGRVPGTRELVLRSNYIAVYAATGGVVTVLRVLHAKRMYPER